MDKAGTHFPANHSLRGVVSIEKILVTQIHILESMAPIGFLEFRDRLNPASGFQSMQFRELEFSSGAKDEKILNSFKNTSSLLIGCEAVQLPVPGGRILDIYRTAGHGDRTYDERIAATVEIISHPEKYAEIYLMQDLLIEHDELIIAWRYNHIQMVERMLGMKRGTGGSEGVGYLTTTLKKKFFPELWEARTHLTVEAVKNEN